MAKGLDKLIGKVRLGAAGGLVAGGGFLVKKIMDAGVENAGSQIAFHMFGVNTDGTVNLKRAAPFWVPIIIGAGVSLLAAKSGINKHMPLGIKL